MDNLIKMLGYSQNRKSLNSIISKWRKLLVETRDKEAFQNILKNVNIINHPDNMDLVEELVSGWVAMYEDSQNQDLIKQFHVIREMMIGDDHVKETMKVIKTAACDIYNDKTARRLIPNIFKVIQLVLKNRDQLRDIFKDGLSSIMKDQDNKLKFLQNLGKTITPMMGTLKNMMPTQVLYEN